MDGQGTNAGFAVFLLLVLAAAAGAIIYVGTSSERPPRFPTQGTFSFANGSISFKGALSKTVLSNTGNRFEIYRDVSKGETTVATFRTSPDGQDAGEGWYVGKETSIETTSASAKAEVDPKRSTVIGELVSKSGDERTYRYTIYTRTVKDASEANVTQSVVLTFTSGKITKIQDGNETIELTGFSDSDPGILTFDESVALEKNEAFKKELDEGRRRGLRRRQLSAWSNFYRSTKSFFSTSYGNYCGKGAPGQCDSLPGTCDDGGFDATCKSHDQSGSYYEDIYGFMTVSLCKIDKDFKAARNAVTCKSGFRDNRGIDCASFKVKANAAFDLAPCLAYEEESYWGWCGWRPCRKKRHEYNWKWTYGRYDKGLGCRGSCYKR